MSSTAADGRTYTRPLGAIETTFYWDFVFNGTADLPCPYVLESNGRRGRDLFTPENITRAWMQVKQRHPLLAARVEVRDEDTKSVHFVVSERRMVEQLPGEIVFQSVAGAEQVSRFIEDIGRGPQRVSSRLPARLFVVTRTDLPNLHHVISNTAHFIADGVSHVAWTRSFFQALATPHAPIQNVPDLEERLALLVACEDLNPTLRLSKPQQRWRRAIAAVLLSIRDSKLQVRRCHVVCFFPEAQDQLVLDVYREARRYLVILDPLHTVPLVSRGCRTKPFRPL